MSLDCKTPKHQSVCARRKKLKRCVSTGAIHLYLAVESVFLIEGSSSLILVIVSSFSHNKTILSGRVCARVWLLLLEGRKGDPEMTPIK